MQQYLFVLRFLDFASTVRSLLTKGCFVKWGGGGYNKSLQQKLASSLQGTPKTLETENPGIHIERYPKSILRGAVVDVQMELMHKGIRAVKTPRIVREFLISNSRVLVSNVFWFLTLSVPVPAPSHLAPRSSSSPLP